ncbi:MAG: DNA repair protein RecO [Saprospiraceae bacterium]|nr:DNA repair protein RecO [Saprospiraceae bacterium]
MSQIIKTEGIVFKSLNYSETSLILDIYTKENGLQSFIVSGVRKAKSKMVNVYHPMNIIDLVAYNNENGLSRIREAQYHYNYRTLYSDVFKSAIGMFIIDLSRNAIREKEVNLEVYNLIKDHLTGIDEDVLSIKNTPLDYTVTLAAYLGFQIQNNFSDHEPYFDLTTGQFVAESQPLSTMLGKDLSEKLHAQISGSTDYQITRTERNQLLDHMINYYQFHVEGFKELKSLSVLRTILS